jgi:hypothetical protein
MSEYLGLYDSAATFANVENIQNFGDEPVEKTTVFKNGKFGG